MLGRVVQNRRYLFVGRNGTGQGSYEKKKKKMFQARLPSLRGKGRGSYLADYLLNGDQEIPD